MARINFLSLSPGEQEKILDRFFTAVSLLDSVEEARDFFLEVSNPNETAMFSRRLLIAERLLAGRTYEEIRRELGVGRDTIARVKGCLEIGRGGYKKVIEKLKKLEGE